MIGAPLDVLLDAFVEKVAARVVELGAAAKPAPARPADPPLPLLTRGQLAALLAVSGVTVDRLCREGMPHFYIGDVRRFDRVLCLAWCAERGQKGAASSERAQPHNVVAFPSDGVFRRVRRARPGREGA